MNNAGLDKFPLIGTLLDAAGLGELALKDVVLTGREGYLAFIASWYKPN